MTSFRFLHAADIHLDSPLIGLSNQAGQVALRIRGATRDALSRLVDLTIKEKVNFLVIAGDLYDGDWRDFNTGIYFIQQMGRLNDHAIPVFLLHGNHDAASQITKQLPLPDNVHVFNSRKPSTFELRDIEVVLHGQSFKQREVTDNLVLNYPDPVSNAMNIGVLHTGLGGMGGHQRYAPCKLSDLVNKGYDYWALGHVHRRRILNENPHVVFPGNLQGRHIREKGPKGAYLVTVESGDIVNLNFFACDVVRWALLEVSLDDIDSVGQVNDSIRIEMEKALSDDLEERLLVCRINLTGRTELHPQLLDSEEQLLADARAYALGFGEEKIWVEKLVIDTEPNLQSLDFSEGEDPLRELQHMMSKHAGDDESLRIQFEKDIGELIRNLPPELRSQFVEDYTKLINQSIPDLISSLYIQGRPL